MGSVKKFFLSILTLLLAAVLSGCLSIRADELYSLPQASEVYLKLQRHIDSLLSTGAEFLPPTGGLNRQAVQLKDLDGDGVDEVVAFFSIPGESNLKIYIFEMAGDDYAVADIIEGVGTEIESIRYVDMDGDGVPELVVGWQMSAALKHMSIYSIKNFNSVLLTGAEYSEIAVFDLGGNGSDNIVAIRLPTQETGAAAEAFTLMPDGEMITSGAWLSNGIEVMSRIQTGRLTDGTHAIFIDSEGKFDDGGVVTDILAFQDGRLTNIALTGAGGVSEETVRLKLNARLHSADINKDGIISVPMPRPFKAQSETTYYAIDWYAFNVQGHRRLEMTTYHNNSDEWYLIIPPDWQGKVSVRREDIVSGERAVIFSHIGGENGPYNDFLKIYKMSGDRAVQRAGLPGRVLIMAEGVSAYAFELLAEPNSFGLTFDGALIRNNFRLIYSDWLAGGN